MSHAPFVHLRAQSAYSMLEGTMQPADLTAAAARHGLPALALTDRNGLYGAMEFTQSCLEAGVQPIIGATLAVVRPDADRGAAADWADWLVLLAQDEAGYANLVRLVSIAHMECGQHASPHVTFDTMAGRSDGLIALTASAEGAVARLLAEGQAAAAAAYLDRLQTLFAGRLYVELSRTDDPVEVAAEPLLIDLAYARDLPLVATNAVAYADPADVEAHDVMLCIADGTYFEAEERRRSSRRAYLRRPDEMVELFADVPEAIGNSLVVARRCAVAAPVREPILPSLAGDREGEVRLLREQAMAGLRARLERTVYRQEDDEAAREDKARPYRQRLDYELDIIGGMGFAGYFLIVADFIRWAKRQGIPVGPGRGSGAGSVVAWSLTITDLDPLRLGLLFERFLNPERVSMPDFDIDFCETRREEVIRYVAERYGRDHVAQIITFGKLKARAVLKDVGRVLQMGFGQVDRLAKLVPNHPTDPWTLDRALNGVAEIAAEVERDDRVRRLFDLARKLEGLPRHASTHAAGVVIGDRPLLELVPLHRDPRSDMAVTQFDMKWVEKAGLVKFDFLGLKTLSVLQRAVELLAARGVTVDLAALPWDDPQVYALLARGDTVGVFQFESDGMRRALSLVRPDCFEDIIALGALYRPGPMDNIPSFANRKHGAEQPDYLHPWLEDVLRETYGVIIYQEQVMQIAQILAGYSLGEADLLRRAMGKKKKEEMDAQKARFLAGAAAKGVDAATADRIFELVAKFAGYGFNKSHAAAYALVTYQTAYLKAHHPVEFYAASLAFDMASTDKLQVLVDDMRRLGVPCLPPCVNASGADFSVEGGAVRYALGACKNVGEKAMAALVEVRQAGGPFRDLEDFCRRIDPRSLNRRQLESLAAAGAFDCLDSNRARVHGMAEVLLAAAQAAAEARRSMQASLFGGPGVEPGLDLPTGAEVAAWTLAENIAREREAFGFFLSAHPLDSWSHVLEGERARSHADVCRGPGPAGGGREACVMAGLIEEVRWRTPPSGKRYLLVALTDKSGQYLASCFDAEVQAEAERLARDGRAVIVRAELLWRPGEEVPRITIRGLVDLEAVARRRRSRLLIELAAPEAVPRVVALLGGARGGSSEARARLSLSGGRFADIALGRDFAAGPDLAAILRLTPGVARAELELL